MALFKTLNIGIGQIQVITVRGKRLNTKHMYCEYQEKERCRQGQWQHATPNQTASLFINAQDVDFEWQKQNTHENT